MNETPASLDDLALFAAVADAGSLGEASRRTGVPLPTLSRRMTALERDLARTLFLRGKRGYALSAEGVSLAAELSGLAEVRRRVERWRSASDARPPVRITAGFWTSHAIARKLSADPERTWLPHFVPATASLDLARREAESAFAMPRRIIRGSRDGRWRRCASRSTEPRRQKAISLPRPTRRRNAGCTNGTDARSSQWHRIPGSASSWPRPGMAS